MENIFKKFIILLKSVILNKLGLFHTLMHMCMHAHACAHTHAHAHTHMHAIPPGQEIFILITHWKQSYWDKAFASMKGHWSA